MTLVATPTASAAPWPTLALGRVIDFSDILTGADRALVIAATGYDVGEPATGDRVPALVVAIALERVAGRLRGPVDAAFLRRNLQDAASDTIRVRALAWLHARAALDRVA